MSNFILFIVCLVLFFIPILKYGKGTCYSLDDMYRRLIIMIVCWGGLFILGVLFLLLEFFVI